MLAALDDIAQLAASTSPLCDVSFEMGVTAAGLLLDPIERGDAPREMMIPTASVIRRPAGSCAGGRRQG